MFANFNFFIYLFSASIVFSLFFLFFNKKINSKVVLSIFSIICWCIIFRYKIYIPIALSIYFYLITLIFKKNIINKLISSLLIISPLFLVKLNLEFSHLLSVIGLSFFTFRAIDVILFSSKQQKIITYEYFAYLFLPLVWLAGPMYRWNSFKRDLLELQMPVSLEKWFAGAGQILYGVVQKFLFAALIYNVFLSDYINKDTIESYLVVAISYSFYLYFDFAGYTNMACGAGKLFGINLPINFNYPILAKNPQDFWRRFHISLSEWLRDVIFMPLYKTLMEKNFFKNHRFFAQNISIFITLFCMGIWNGLEINYIISGTLFGFYSVMHNCLIHYTRDKDNIANILNTKLISLFGRLTTLTLICFSLYIFSGYSFIK
ncbi:MBOAT family O-acyltransferase [Photorhabdus luminescens]|uniref:Probable alginate O-acetylase AlgI n=1 Tax=Photorhabdus luminescens subsp. mexicana TaxID=2100167 RepID=A0A4R4J617_PHOLU|nr:MBOAT family O-acyltransferase [Photorhabdus luminescens]TDB48139.1 membrane-bound O-acyltransferase [Photorhabdus luminescens subsp. mexicana]